MQVDIELYRRELRFGRAPRSALSAIDIAPEEADRTLVFVHGFGGSAVQWRYQLTHFSDRHRVIALDLRGHGLSDAEGGYDLATLLDDLDDALKALDVPRKFVLIGHSFGGALAIEYALRHPGRISHLVLIATTGRYPLAWYFRWALHLPLALLNAVYPVLRPIIPAPPHVLKSFYFQTLRSWDGWDRLHQLHPPTLVIRGYRDRVFERPLFERVSREIPTSEDVNVGASGHMVMLERRDAVNRAIDRFLGEPRKSWRASVAVSLLRRRPWLAHYDRGVPHTISIPQIRLEELLSSATRRFPGRPAIEFFGRTLSYRSLEREANRLAHGLLALGLERGDRVMILLPNLPQMVIGFFGCLKAGGVAAFATPLSEPEELIRQIDDSGARFLLTLPDLTEVAGRALQETNLEHVVLTTIDEFLPPHKAVAFRLRHRSPRKPLPARGFVRLRDLTRGRPRERPLIPGDAGDLAVLIYTGGTTDRPKGVMLSHGNLVANSFQTRHWLPDVREGREVMLAILPFSHIYGLMTAMIVPVTMAAAMVILPRFATEEVLTAIRSRRPTLFPGVPAMYTAISDFPSVRRYNVGSIRACISGAAPLPVEVQEAFERLTRGRLVEGYGLTEASPVTHANPFSGVRKPGSIGFPFPSTEAKVVDLARGRDLPPGQIGELAVRGPQVMQGYWNDPRATRESLTRSGWLLTGDLARMDGDGYFQIVARKKEMILAGRYQVFPRDVEEVLYEHPKVREAAVVGVQAPRSPRRTVKAFVVLRHGEEATEDELIQLCRGRLESYAVPWKIEFVPELPKSFVGKVLRRILIERSEDELGPVAARGTAPKRRR
ncbi:MAG TPA: alpha/beta fold hydrolase [Anaerolineales bacterium]|nr:alpha/beta fold hydrolase [Anaerolineales bacterium]